VIGLEAFHGRTPDPPEEAYFFQYVGTLPSANSDSVALCSITFHSVLLATLAVHVAPVAICEHRCDCKQMSLLFLKCERNTHSKFERCVRFFLVHHIRTLVFLKLRLLEGLLFSVLTHTHTHTHTHTNTHTHTHTHTHKHTNTHTHTHTHTNTNTRTRTHTHTHAHTHKHTNTRTRSQVWLQHWVRQFCVHAVLSVPDVDNVKLARDHERSHGRLQ
jgi:hypothetical protein